MTQQRHLLAQNQRRTLGIQDPSSVYRGEIPAEFGTIPVAPTPVEPTPPAQQFTGTLTATQLNALSPWLLAVTLGSTGNTDLIGGYLACDVVKIHDSDDSHELSIVWNEAEASANRTLNLLVRGGNRTLDLYENLTIANGSNVTLQALGQANSLVLNESLTIGDGNDGTITFSAASKTLSIDETKSLSDYFLKDGTRAMTGNIVMPADGVIGVTDGNPQIVFDNTNNWLEITGNVGIGTPTPGYKLDITDDTETVVFRMNSVNGPAMVFNDTTENKIWAINIGGSPPHIYFNYNDVTAAGNVLSMEDTGEVNIGLTPAGAVKRNFNIYDNGVDGKARMALHGTAGMSASPSIEMTIEGSLSKRVLIRLEEEGSNDYGLGFFTTNNSSVSRKLTLSGDGNLGLAATTFGANMVGGMALALGTDPTADVANQFAFWGKDFAAGNTCPYFRTENGTVIGLNQSLLTTDNVIHNRLALTGGFKANLVTKTGAYTTTADDYTILCDASGGSFTITLIALASHLKGIYHIKKTDASANTVTLDGNGGETIDGGLTAVLTTQYESITIQAGSEWGIL